MILTVCWLEAMVKVVMGMAMGTACTGPGAGLVTAPAVLVLRLTGAGSTLVWRGLTMLPPSLLHWSAAPLLEMMVAY